jgi:hypothetical protein
MIKLILITICLGAVEVYTCHAGPDESLETTNWGMSIQGVQMALKISNTVVDTDSPIKLLILLTNSSTNSIEVITTGTVADFDFVLTTSAGRAFHLRPPFPLEGMAVREMIKPGQQKIQPATVSIKKSIKAGDYTFKAIRSFRANGRNFKAESSSLKVRIKALSSSYNPFWHRQADLEIQPIRINYVNLHLTF